MKYNRKYYNCDCGTHILTLEKWEEDRPELDLFCIANFSMGHRKNESLTWKERFRWCWQIIRRGNVWGDMITLNRDEANRLALDIQEMTYVNPFNERKND